MPPVEGLRDSPAGKAPLNKLHVYGVVPPLAESVWLYVVLTVPFGKEAVLIDNTEALTVMLSALLAFCCGVELSPTWTVKLLVPAAVGVPVMAPVAAFKERPAGKAPTVTDQEYGNVPPVADNVWL
jgi:hypothetical protein